MELREDEVCRNESGVGKKQVLRIGAQSPDEVMWFEECKGFQPVKLIVK